jgi:hypothetical protein
MSNGIPKVYGVAAEFPNAGALLRAAEKIRDDGYRRWDVYTPYPVHGMDKAMGLGKSWLSAVVLAGGVTGLLTATALEMFPSFELYPLVVHGKPTDFFSVPAFFPIMFELTILLSAFACIGALLVFNQLPKWYHPMFNWERFTKVTDDGFFLAIEARDPQFSEEKVRGLLKEIGGDHVTLIHD